MSDRLALIIANSEFDDPKLSRLVTPSRDAEALAKVLSDPNIGGFKVTLLLDETETIVRRKIARLYHRRKRGDLLLLYYSGHGIKDEYSGELYLATKDTEMDIASATALSAAFVRGQIDKSDSQRKVVVLDCCHSGAFAEAKAALGSSAGAQEVLAGNGYGRVILTASNALEFAWQGDQLLGEAETSVFTHFLVKGLRTGAADRDGDGQISLDELYEYVHEQVIANSKQTPQKSVLKVEGRVIIAQNPLGAKQAALAAPSENLATQLLERVPSMVTDNITGGGSMTATALAQAIVSEGLERVAAGSNPTLLKRGILAGADAVVEAIADQAIMLTATEELANVAATSAQDREIGEWIAEVMDRVGRDGFITLEESNRGWFETEYVEGMNFDRGYVSDYFLTNPEWDEAVIEAPYVLIHDKRISEAQDLAPILEKLVQKGERNLVVIAEDVDGDALGTLVQSKLRGDMSVLAVRAPGVGDYRKAILHDIAIVTGGTVISAETGLKLESARINYLGRAGRVVSTKHDTTIIDGAGDKDAVWSRANQIRTEIETSTSDEDIEKLQERLAKLAGGKAIMRVPGATKTERREKKREVEKALAACRAAIEGGIVPGGGVALINAVDSLDKVKMDSEDENIGVAILRRALEAPMKKIAADAGQDGALVVGEVRRRQKETKNDHIGYDVTSGKYRDMMEAGITDSAKVIRRALEIAVSIAATIFNELHATRRAKPLS